MKLNSKHFLKLLDFTPEEINYLLDLSAELKAKKKAGISHKLCEGKNIALIFEKNSTRTRCAFEVAAADLGMHPVFLDPQSSQIGKKESIADTARVLASIYDGIEYRGRKLSVSYSRRKESYTSPAAESQEAVAETDAVESAPVSEVETNNAAE